MKTPVKPVILIVLDGWGLAPQNKGNAIEAAKKPYFDYLYQSFPHTQLQAAGEAIGLPHKEDGNSEVGHLNLGAGRIVYQNIVRINLSIADGTFIKNQAFLEAVKHTKKNNSALHLLGLIGTGSVHSSFEHLISLLWFCRERGVDKVFIHLITDGRDSPPHAVTTLVRILEEKLVYIQLGKIASVIGRYYAMDRDFHWDRTEKAYNCLTVGSPQVSRSAVNAVQKSYKAGITDEFISPVSIVNREKKPIGLVKNNDAVIFFNYREDRARQLTKAFVLPEFETTKIFHQGIPLQKGDLGKTFQRENRIKNLFFVTMIEYEKNLPVSAVAFPTVIVPKPLSQILAAKHKKQFHIAETEKYAHVTYFFNGGREDPFPYEDWVLIPSPPVPTYDLKPEMSAQELTEITIERLEMQIYDFMIVNYANPDMVAHTGDFKATVQAIETVDGCLKQLVNAIMNINGIAIVTADHGNAEELLGQGREIDTKHSNNLVPFILVGKELLHQKLELKNGILADVAPTILYLMGIPKPKEMTGMNLIAG